MFLRLPNHPTLIVLLSVASEGTIRVVVFCSSVVPLNHRRSPLVGHSQFRDATLRRKFHVVNLMRANNRVLRDRSQNNRRSNTVEAHVRPFNDLTSLLRLLGQFPDQFIQVKIRRRARLLNGMFRHVYVAMSFSVRRVQRNALSTGLTKRTLRRVLTKTSHRFLHTSTLKTFTGVVLTKFSRFPRVLRGIGRPTIQH